MELNPGDAGFQDRYIVQEIIKEMAKNRPIDTKGKKGFRGNAIDFLFFFLLTCVNFYQYSIFSVDLETFEHPEWQYCNLHSFGVKSIF